MDTYPLKLIMEECRRGTGIMIKFWLDCVDLNDKNDWMTKIRFNAQIIKLVSRLSNYIKQTFNCVFHIYFQFKNDKVYATWFGTAANLCNNVIVIGPQNDELLSARVIWFMLHT